MCPNDSSTIHQILTDKDDRMFDSEADSDVTFVVGPEKDSWRFPAHRSVLANANSVFKAMLTRYHTDTNTIVIQDVDGRAFEILLRYLYNREVQILSVETALYTVYAAQKYLVSGLVAQCVDYLNASLNHSNVLLIYPSMRLYSGQMGGCQRSPYHASAPPFEDVCLGQECVLEKDSNDNIDEPLFLQLFSQLLEHCLKFIDVNADEVLALESVEDLSADSLKEILDRDSLLVTSECVVYSAIERWSNRECKRNHLPLSLDNRRSVLGDELLFTPRYLTMTLQQFSEGPVLGNLLTPLEIKILTSFILDRAVTSNLSTTLTSDVIAKISTPRRPFGQLPCSLTPSPDSPVSSTKSKCSKKCKKSKHKEKKDKSKKKCDSTCFTDCFVRVLACLFD